MTLPKTWLVVRLSALGDVVLTTGVLLWLHRTRGWRFVVLTRPQWAPVFRNHPAVDRVATVDPRDLRPAALPGFVRGLAASLPGAGLLDLHGTLRSRLLGLLWPGPVRRYPKFSLERRLFLRSGGRLFRERLRASNVTQRYALAVQDAPPPRSALLPRILLDDAERARGVALLREAGLLPTGTPIGTPDGVTDAPPAPARPLVALHPYSTHPDKAWLPGAWRDLAGRLSAAGYAWFVVGRSGGKGNAVAEAGSDDATPLSGFVEQARVAGGLAADFTDRTDLRETCALLAAADLLVTGDSGPMHLAAGVDTPVVALFGPTTREWGFYPEGPRDVVLETGDACRPCSLHGSRRCAHSERCMTGIAPDAVFAAVRRVTDGGMTEAGADAKNS
ncbi:glycosyltransferase family 9 protein [Nitratidesulfovibrio liaohensis]|uniref:Glycosyltransferase family 9 protein n=1 Tax=Nitratidesulfovibrio liaohensis TaxID=2604158 RepID=A0ABY9R6E0_9BACT|nr:glycosyltransferase family 9 protein [Nitratidesulfovibrio liaohensis]WMW66180.1 glycosyltransferase family 9 protein [Nitratidesulfovibrio liaohensis]